ncbi:MAG: acetolactate synthase small subunit [Buchananella hordeovulneris]|nr:acetolactate synthase small subunit [Buchananella hordeovulneris]
MTGLKTLSILVENKPGVLTRISALFARRAFNIHSLAVGPTEEPSISRVTALVDPDPEALEQIRKQLDKLVNVLQVHTLDAETSVQRELMLVKVAANATNRTSVLEIVDLFRAHVVDVHTDSIVVETLGSRSKIAALLEALAPYGITEIAKSGAVAITRGPASLTQQFKENNRG